MASSPFRDSSLLPFFAKPMRSWPRRGQVLAVLLATLAEVVWSALVRRQWGSYFGQPDVPFYLRIARGDMTHVMMPFAARQLGPLLVAGAAHVFGWTIENAFIREGFLFFVFAIAVVWAMNVTSAAPRWMLVAVFFVPYWPFLLESLGFPDIIYAALMAMMLWAMARDRWMLAALLFFPMMVARESTSLTLVCFLVAVWPRHGWRVRGTAIAATLAGVLVSAHLTRINAGNNEHLPAALYLFAKVPWNFMRNVLGLVPWSTINDFYCSKPVWQMHLPLGPVKSVGICGFDPAPPIGLILDVMSGFGLMPLLAGVLWWRNRRRRDKPALLRFLLLYGWVSFLLAPALGSWFLHIAGYAWPLFGVGCTLMLSEFERQWGAGRREWAGLAFLALHLFVCAAYFRLHFPVYIGTLVAVWAAAFVLLRVWLRKPETAVVAA